MVKIVITNILFKTKLESSATPPLKNDANDLAYELLDVAPGTKQTRMTLERLSTTPQALALAVVDYVFRFPSHDKDRLGQQYQLLDFDTDLVKLVKNTVMARSANLDVKRFLNQDEIEAGAGDLALYIEKLFINLFQAFYLVGRDLNRKILSLKKQDSYYYGLAVSMEEIAKEKFNDLTNARNHQHSALYHPHQSKSHAGFQ